MVAKSKLIYFIEISWLLSLLILASMVYLNHELVGTFFNSDWMMFPKFIQDIFLGHGHYKDWTISPAPHFFPDMVIFTPFFLLIKNIYFQFQVSMWIMIVLIYLGVKFIYYQFFSIKETIIFALASTSSLVLLGLKQFSPYILALAPVVHVGEFIAGLFLVGIQIKMISRDKLDFISYSLCGVSALIAFAAGVSDLLFIVQFSAPIFVAYSFLYMQRYIRFNQFFLFASLVIFSSILGGFSTKYLVPKDILFDYLGRPSIMKLSFNTLGIPLLAFVNMMKSINIFLKIIFSIFYAAVLVFIGILVSTRISKKKFNLDKKIIFLNLFIFFSILLTILSACLLSNSNLAYITDRYFIPIYFFTFLFFFFSFYCFNNYSLISKIFTYLAFLIALYIISNIYILYHKPGFTLNKDYYPQDVRCIDEALREYGHHGIAQFWDANFISILSKENLQIVPVNIYLTPFYWAVNVRKFENPISFIIFDNDGKTLNKDLINKKFGNPKKEIICYTRTILIYKKDSLKL